MKQSGTQDKNIMTLNLRRNSGNVEERARRREGRMEPSSGGAGTTSALRSAGLGESLGMHINDLPRRRRSMDEDRRERYYDSYWNRSYSSNQRTWSTEEEEEEDQQRSLQAGYGCFAVFSALAIFVSIWLLFGLYGNQRLEMGMCYSRVIRANGFFVRSEERRVGKECRV